MPRYIQTLKVGSGEREYLKDAPGKRKHYYLLTNRKQKQSKAFHKAMKYLNI